MKKYDLNVYWRLAKVRIYIQMDEYKGHFDVNVRGNIKGLSIIESALDIEYLEQKDVIDNNCNLKLFEDSEKYNCFSCELKNENGDTLETDGDTSFLEDLVVGCEIIEYEEYDHD